MNIFDKILQSLPENTKRRKATVIIAEYATYIVAISYILVAIALLITKNSLIIRFILVPATVFLFSNILRYLIDRQRPFEKYNFKPLIPKNKGKSFPSNHTVSAFVIAVAFMRINVILGVLMLIPAFAVSLSRLLIGVHYPTDIICGALIGITGGVIGFFIV